MEGGHRQRRVTKGVIIKTMTSENITVRSDFDLMGMRTRRFKFTRVPTVFTSRKAEDHVGPTLEMRWTCR